MMTPRQLTAYNELYSRAQIARDRVMLNLLRAAAHADKKGFKEFAAKMDKQS